MKKKEELARAEVNSLPGEMSSLVKGKKTQIKLLGARISKITDDSKNHKQILSQRTTSQARASQTRGSILLNALGVHIRLGNLYKS